MNEDVEDTPDQQSGDIDEEDEHSILGNQASIADNQIHPDLLNDRPATPPRFQPNRNGLLYNNDVVGKTQSGASRSRGERSGPTPGEPSSPCTEQNEELAAKATRLHAASARNRKHSREPSSDQSGLSSESRSIKVTNHSHPTVQIY